MHLTGLPGDVALSGYDILFLPAGNYTISVFTITEIYNYEWRDTPAASTPDKQDWSWSVKEVLF